MTTKAQDRGLIKFTPSANEPLLLLRLPLSNFQHNPKYQTDMVKVKSSEAPPLPYGAVKHQTLIHALKHNAATTPNQICLRWANNKCEITDSLDYRQLLERATAVAALLVQNGVVKGDRVMISYPFGLDPVVGIFGCMLLGVIPCSVYPPNPQKKTAVFSFRQFNEQVKDAGAKFALTTTKYRQLLRATAVTTSHKTSVTWLTSDKLEVNFRSENFPHMTLPIPEEPALIQYSSGSTGEPKGVVLSHGAIVNNLESIWTGRKDNGQMNCSGCTWMPQYHDFALIWFMIGPVYSDKDPCVMCSPTAFIQNPLLWADMIEKFKPTRTAGPNFAYSLLAKRMNAAGRVIENSTLLCTSIAAEPIAPETLTKMTAIGFPAESIVPCYGMAEACVYLSSCYAGASPRVLEGAVCCGDSEVHESSGTFIVIVDDASGRIIRDGSVGEICVRSPSLASGYWNKPELTQERFHAKFDDGHEYFKTGDLGRIVSDRHLFVVGRRKELIIINGKNIYPTDIEREVEAAYSKFVRPGSTVAFQYSDSDAGLVLELRRTIDPVEAAEMLSYSKIRRLVSDAYGVQLGLITLLHQGTVPKTTSGKLRRVETKKIATSAKWKPACIVWTWTGVKDSTPGWSKENLEEAVGLEKDFKNVLQDILGGEFDMSLCWEDNGLTSLGQVELSTLISKTFRVILSPSYTSEYETPKALLSFIKASSNTAFDTYAPELEIERTDLSSTYVGYLQLIGVVIQMFTLALTFMGTYFIVSFIMSDRIQSTVTLRRGVTVSWYWFPIAVPVAMLLLTSFVLAAKWIVVGRYKADIQFSVQSKSFVRWWFVDRMVHLWEFWVGKFLMDTPVLWCVYWLMGANIHPSARIDCFIREFDLVTIGRASHVSHSLNCRRFSLREEHSSPFLRFRLVTIGKNCKIEGLVGLGANVGDGSFVAKASVLEEGKQVEAKSVVKGNPAFRNGTNEPEQWQPLQEMCLKMLKTFWLAVELYLFFGAMGVAQVIWIGQLPRGWRYTPLCTWILLLLSVSVLNLILSAVLKWVLIGRRSTRQRASPTLWTKSADWVCDYHFRLSGMLLTIVTSRSRLWNIILGLHGLDTDFLSSFVTNFSLLPSIVDQLCVKRSFVSSGVAFESGGETSVLDSSIGYRVSVGPNVQIHRSTIAAFMEVGQSAYDQNYPKSPLVTTKYIFFCELWTILVASLVFVSLIPAFEFFNIAVRNSTVILTLPGLVLTMLIQSLSWTMTLRLIQAIALCLKAYNTEYAGLYHIYIHMSYETKCWAQWPMLYGTPFCNLLLKFMGSTVLGDLLYNGTQAHDFHALIFEDKTIVDESQITGHYQVGNELTIGTCRVAGLLHPECFTVADTKLVGNIERGPRQAYFQQDDGLGIEMTMHSRDSVWSRLEI